MQYFFRIIIKFAVSFFCLLSPLVSANQKPNIILMIGDGMGPSYTSAFRYYQNSPEVKATIFDKLYVGKSSTHPDDEYFIITDSSAAATAMSTGIKTYNKAVAVDNNHQPLKTILEVAKEEGFHTAMVVTSSIANATPASFAAHVNNRSNYNEIADQYIDAHINGKPKVDLLFGGGKKHLIREDRNIVSEFKRYGYEYAHDWHSFNQLKTLPALALLAENQMTYAIESNNKTQLKTMTKKALSLLDKTSTLSKKPFFLMVEGSLIDMCGHYNDIACAMAEMHDFAETLKLIKTYIDKHPNTVFVATADHSTGGFSRGADLEIFTTKPSQYNWFPEVIKGVKAFSVSIVRELLQHPGNWQAQWNLLTEISLSDNEVLQFNQLIKDFKAPDNLTNIMLKKNYWHQLVPLHTLTIGIINQRSSTGWTGAGHTGIDVEVFSYGQYAKEFSGHIDNTDIAKKLIKYLK